MAFDALASSFSRRPFSEKRATPITRLPARRAGQARERRPHLAADAEHHDVVDAARDPLQARGDGARHELFEGSTSRSRQGS